MVTFHFARRIGKIKPAKIDRYFICSRTLSARNQSIAKLNIKYLVVSRDSHQSYAIPAITHIVGNRKTAQRRLLPVLRSL